MKLVRLSSIQKKALFKTIRYSYCKHEDLLGLTLNKQFELAKEFVIEGLSVRLNPYENAIKTELKINTQPRVNFEQAKIAAQGGAINDPNAPPNAQN